MSCGHIRSIIGHKLCPIIVTDFKNQGLLRADKPVPCLHHHFLLSVDSHTIECYFIPKHSVCTVCQRWVLFYFIYTLFTIFIGHLSSKSAQRKRLLLDIQLSICWAQELAQTKLMPKMVSCLFVCLFPRGVCKSTDIPLLQDKLRTRAPFNSENH